MGNGWIKLHRKTLDNPVFKHDRTAWHVFQVLMLIADTNGQWSGGLNQLAELTGMNRNTLFSATGRLKKAKMINTSSNTRYTQYNIVNWEDYQADVKHFVKRSSNTDQTPVKRSSNARQNYNKNKNKELELDNSNKLLLGDSPETISFGDPTVNEVFAFWEQAVGYPITSRVTYNRRAASNLIKKHGIVKLKQLISGVSIAHSDPYAPRIADFTALQAKSNDLIAWGQRQRRTKQVAEF